MLVELFLQLLGLLWQKRELPNSKAFVWRGAVLTCDLLILFCRQFQMFTNFFPLIWFPKFLQGPGNGQLRYLITKLCKTWQRKFLIAILLLSWTLYSFRHIDFPVTLWVQSKISWETLKVSKFFSKKMKTLCSLLAEKHWIIIQLYLHVQQPLTCCVITT
jgi:hypothetical protein